MKEKKNQTIKAVRIFRPVNMTAAAKEKLVLETLGALYTHSSNHQHFSELSPHGSARASFSWALASTVCHWAVP